MPAAIYLSPHLDDVALSCGGQIARRARAGDEVLVVTVFAGDEPGSGLSGLARRLHRVFGLDREVVAARRREDLAGCRRLGAAAEHWDLLEAIYRREPLVGAHLYPDLESLFGTIRAADDDLRAALRERLRGLPGGAAVFAPLAVGGHVDHRLLREAAEAELTPRLAYWEDYPYVEKWRALGRALGAPRGWRPETLPLDEDDLAAKIEAVAAFRSQVGALFGSRRKLERRVRRRARRLGGERVWRKEERA